MKGMNILSELWEVDSATLMVGMIRAKTAEMTFDEINRAILEIVLFARAEHQFLAETLVKLCETAEVDTDQSNVAIVEDLNEQLWRLRDLEK